MLRAHRFASAVLLGVLSCTTAGVRRVVAPVPLDGAVANGAEMDAERGTLCGFMLAADLDQVCVAWYAACHLSGRIPPLGARVSIANDAGASRVAPVGEIGSSTAWDGRGPLGLIRPSRDSFTHETTLEGCVANDGLVTLRTRALTVRGESGPAVLFELGQRAR
jgi:hypothetical protein